MGHFQRYAMAFAGPAATAGAQFLLSLVLLRVMAPDMFGHFSFLLILSQFSLGIWSALFSAALPVINADRDLQRGSHRMATLFAANLLSTVPAIPLFMSIALAFHMPLTIGLPFAFFVALSLLRLFARTHAYAIGRPARVMVSDVSYSLIVLAGLPVLLLADIPPGPSAALLLAAAALVALVLFGPAYLRLQFAPFPKGLLGRYAAIWKEHSGWSLLGVLTTEATMNAHAYVVTLFAGPSAFAVLAASSLLTRPVTVVMSALGEYERAHMAEQIAQDDAPALGRSINHFRLAMAGIWLLTGVALAVIMIWVPHLVFPPRYALGTLAIGSTLWMAVALVRAMRAPESAMMQGAGEFRPLANASVYSAIFSVVGVAGLLALTTPVWSIGGVLIGELIFGICLWPRAWAWRRAMAARAGEARG